MQINTVVYQFSTWKVKVHTKLSQYQSYGAYYTCCSIVYDNGATISLVSKYSTTMALAASNHFTISQKAKELFSLKDSK